MLSETVKYNSKLLRIIETLLKKYYKSFAKISKKLFFINRSLEHFEEICLKFEKNIEISFTRIKRNFCKNLFDFMR